MKSLMLFVQKVLQDLEDWCHISTIRDFKTITERVEHEGLSFLTITLPKFGSDLQKGLDRGFVDHDLFQGFSWTGGLPRFLSGFLGHVFDRESGVLLPSPSVAHIHAIRQLTLMFAKIEIPCTDARVSRAIEGYVECEQEVRQADATMDPDRLHRYSRIALLLWGDVFSFVDREVYEGNIYPKHGPGATADSLRGNAKWNQFEWTERLEQVFPHGEHLAPNWRYFIDLHRVRILEPGAERPVRVITVPKTLKSPRIIAVEPTCMQYMQQGLLASLRARVDADDIASALIGSASQVPNQHLAEEGSRNGALATLDLSEASDRVSNQHVRALLGYHRNLFEAVDSCRSRKADVPGHGVIRLAKFASMGSALTFDIEAMVFATIIFSAIERELKTPMSRTLIKEYLGKVRVYGDDIIVPTRHVHSVMQELEAFGLRVNADKSFWTGKFRESCGKDYYDGHDVSIVRMRSEFPADRGDAQKLVSTLEFRNHLYEVGLWKSARYLDDLLGGLMPLPRVAKTASVLGRHSFLGYETQRICDLTHAPLVRGLVRTDPIPRSPLDGVGALMKVFTLAHYSSLEGDAWWPTSLPSGRSDHLERYGRPRSVDTKTRWGSPF